MMPARSAEQEQFAASLHEMLAAADVPGAARQWAGGDQGSGLAVWRKLAGAGVTALAVPERWGGLGASPLDIVVACEELGHHALPGPVAESVAVVPWLIAALADDALSGRWLPRLAAGDVLATVALPPRLPYAADADAAGLVLLAETGTGASAEAGLPPRVAPPPRPALPPRVAPPPRPALPPKVARRKAASSGWPNQAPRAGRWTRPGRCSRSAAARCWPVVPA